MEQNALIEQLLTLTLAIEHAATLADWPGAARLMEERSPLFASLLCEQDAAAMGKVDRIRAIDAAVTANAKITQTQLQAEYNGAMRHIQAASKYQEAARL
jgi:flagellar protein FliT